MDKIRQTLNFNSFPRHTSWYNTVLQYAVVPVCYVIEAYLRCGGGGFQTLPKMQHLFKKVKYKKRKGGGYLHFLLCSQL